MWHKKPGQLWECVEADVFTINNKHYLCILDYHSKFPVVKQVEGFSTDNLINACKIISSEYGMSSKIVSDAGTNTVSETSKIFSESLTYNM